jgi:O-antigen ligase
MILGVLVLIYGVLFGVLAYKRIEWAVALVVFLLPSYLVRFSVVEVPMTLLEVMILVLFGVQMYRLVYRWYRSSRDQRLKVKSQKSNYKWLILLFLLAGGVGVFVSVDWVAGLGIWKAYFVEPVMFFFVFINVISRDKLSLITRAIGGSALIVAIPAVVQKFWPIGIENGFWAAEETRRVVSWYGFPNAVGLYLGAIVVLLIGVSLKSTFDCAQVLGKIKSRSLKGFYILTIILSVLAVLFARSEGALVGIIVGVVLLGVVLIPRMRIRGYLLSLVLLAGLLVFLLPGLQEVEDKLLLRDVSGQIRQQQWDETAEMLKDGRVLFGSGLSNYQNAIEPYHQEGVWIEDYNDPDWLKKINRDEEFRKAHWQPVEIYMYPHNFILNFWVEIGFGGLIVFLFLIIRFIQNYKKCPDESKEMYKILIIVLMAILVHGLVDVPYFKNDLSVFFWLIMGMGVVLSEDTRKKFK